MITVQTNVKAPIDKVWQFWTTPNHITKWNTASEDWHTPFAENDLRAGGKFKSTMTSKDGKMSFDFEGTYTDILQNEIIKYEMTDGRKVEILFSKNGEEVIIKESFDPENENSEELQRAGWQAILDNFKKYVENSMTEKL